VDNTYNLFIDGKSFPAPKDYGWPTINTQTVEVKGTGPWLVALEGIDVGVIAGFLGAVYVDGQPVAATGVPGNPFRVTNVAPKTGWNTDLAYDDWTW
jgi:hypothetical protein